MRQFAEIAAVQLNFIVVSREEVKVVLIGERELEENFEMHFSA